MDLSDFSNAAAQLHTLPYHSESRVVPLDKFLIVHGTKFVLSTIRQATLCTIELHSINTTILPVDTNDTNSENHLQNL